jgi:hypothetical protein
VQYKEKKARKIHESVRAGSHIHGKKFPQPHAKKHNASYFMTVNIVQLERAKSSKGKKKQVGREINRKTIVQTTCIILPYKGMGRLLK